MPQNPFQRGGAFRRPRRTESLIAGPDAGRPELQSRHPAMRGISVSPVHGWHCICDRCVAQSGQQH
jgi:hypothetical protein